MEQIVFVGLILIFRFQKRLPQWNDEPWEYKIRRDLCR